MPDNKDRIPVDDDIAWGISLQAATAAVANFSRTVHELSSKMSAAATEVSFNNVVARTGQQSERKSGEQKQQTFRDGLSRASANIKAGNLRGAASSLRSGAAGAFPALAIFNTAINATVESLNRMSREQQNYSRMLAQVSPDHAAIQGQRNLLETFRNMEIGRRTAISANTMMQAEQGYKQGTKEIDVLVANTKNTVAAVWEGFKTVVVAPLNGIAKDINKFFGKEAEPGTDPISLGQWMKDVADQMDKVDRFDHPKFRHPTFRRD